MAQSSLASPGGKCGAGGHLGAAFGVHVGHRLLGVGCRRQDHIGAVGAGVAMGSHVDHKGCSQFVCIDFVSAAEEQDVKVALLCGGANAPGALAAFARKRANIKRAHAACGGVENVEAVPVSLHDADCGGGLGGKGQNGRAIGTGQVRPAR